MPSELLLSTNSSAERGGGVREAEEETQTPCLVRHREADYLGEHTNLN